MLLSFFHVVGGRPLDCMFQHLEIRLINNTINMLKIQVDTCKNHLENTLDKESMEECMGFIKKKKESRHLETLEHQKSKFQRLCQKSRKVKGGCSNTKHGDHDEIERNTTSDSQINAITNNNNTWVRNISSTPLTEAQLKVLLHGPNFAVVPRFPPVGEYIASTEQACSQLKQGEAEELSRGDQVHPEGDTTPKSNITKEEKKALAELRRDNNRIILTAEKRVSMVVMNEEEYITKVQELLDQPAYKPILTDPTTKYKNKLISLLKTIRTEVGINEVIYRRLYPTGAGYPKFYGLPKVHKEGKPFRPIVSSIGAVTYETSKELSRILKPLMGKSPYQVQNNQEFLQHLEGIQLGPDEIIMSYDLKALFTSVPILPALNII